MSFIRSTLDPSDILGELLFGLIMVLTFTLGAAVAGGYETGLLLAATGCNVAWGVIDAVLVTLSGRYVRRRRGQLVRALREAPDEASALAAIREQFEDGVEAELRPEDRDALYRSIHRLFARAQPLPMHLTRDDWKTAFAVFVLVSATALPAALPFLVVDDPHLALRLSNALLVALLFVIGWRWGRHIRMNAFLCALGLTAMGVVLVLVAIRLGG